MSLSLTTEGKFVLPFPWHVQQLFRLASLTIVSLSHISGLYSCFVCPINHSMSNAALSDFDQLKEKYTEQCDNVSYSMPSTICA